MAEHFGALALPVGEFLALEHGTEFVGYTRIQEDEVIHTAGHKFVTDRVARTRPRTPGEEVGQSLVLAHKDVSSAVANARLKAMFQCCVLVMYRPCVLMHGLIAYSLCMLTACNVFGRSRPGCIYVP